MTVHSANAADHQREVGERAAAHDAAASSARVSAGTSSAASCSASSFCAARRPPSARRPRSPYSTVKSASALARRAAIRRARDVDPLAVRVERADEVVEARRAARPRRRR